MNPRKTLELILRGSRNVRFSDFERLVEAFGFRLSRVSGSHPPQLAQIRRRRGARIRRLPESASVLKFLTA